MAVGQHTHAMRCGLLGLEAAACTGHGMGMEMDGSVNSEVAIPRAMHPCFIERRERERERETRQPCSVA
jgi:hypothetical protein